VFFLRFGAGSNIVSARRIARQLWPEPSTWRVRRKAQL